MHCQQVLEDLVAYLDHELDGDTAHSIRAHLDSCPECRARVEEHQAVWTLLDRVRAAPASAGFLESVRARVRRLEPVLRLPPIRFGSLVAAAAVLLLVLVPFGVDFLRPDPASGLTQAEIDAALNLEVLENLDLVGAMDVLPAVDDPAVFGTILELGEEVY